MVPQWIKVCDVDPWWNHSWVVVRWDEAFPAYMHVSLALSIATKTQSLSSNCHALRSGNQWDRFRPPPPRRPITAGYRLYLISLCFPALQGVCVHAESVVDLGALGMRL